jgi:hypothetical protein
MRMKPALVARRLAGWISVVAMLLLSSPGVRVVRAEDAGPISEVPPGPACSADDIGSVVLTIALPSQEEAELRREREARPRVVPLDGGGNRYGAMEPPAPAPASR